MGKLAGFLWGLLSGASFGLIPLFTLPLFASGFAADTILFYRFTTAAAIIGLILLVRRDSFRITSTQFIRLVALGVLYMSSALFLLWGYEYMAAGIATTVHFLYPVCVVLLMIIFFGERASLTNIGAVMLAIIGVALLSTAEGTNGQISTKGLIIVIISALAYALYIIGIKKMKLGSIGGFAMTFYVLLITAILFLVKALIFGDGIAPLRATPDMINVFLLGLVPTVISNFALVKSVKLIGSTTTSILGACEPLTAVVIGVTVFNEPLTTVLMIGILLIISAVASIILRKT